MLKRSLLAGLLTYFFTFLLLLAVFGQGGYLHNRALEAEIQRLSYNQNLLQIQIQALERQEAQMGKEDALRDAAFKYGYQSEGEVVYYFPLEERESPDILEDRPIEGRREYFEGVGRSVLALWALLPAFLAGMLAYVIGRRRFRG
ncbi:MAG TPA: septum formation initiator family protein [Sphaerochaeta sp.]|jgi:cell division protein FtsB|nr:septum formation initiator family protein [Spirochaetota bacterium]NLL24653.1 hypothetical protein [Spirochaetales bacterium]HPK64110.1 septum formation initiator family protein [Sphaerochaeta sp.]